MSIESIPSEVKALEMGVGQVQKLSKNRGQIRAGMDVVAADGMYGNAQVLRPLQAQNCGIVVRLRRDRVLYGAPEQPQKRKRGRPQLHGERFAFKQPVTWGAPDEVMTFEHAKFGQVKLQPWHTLHGKHDADVPFDVIRASIHLEKDKPPQPLCLAWQAPVSIPDNLEVDAKLIWQAYIHRWPVEPGIRFRNPRLGWTTPQFQHKETGGRSGKKNYPRRLDLLQFDCQSTIFINLIHDQVSFICLNAN